MALKNNTFTTRGVRNRRNTSTARGYVLNQRQIRLDQRASIDIENLVSATQKKLSNMAAIRKTGKLPFTRQELESQYRELENSIIYYTNQANTLRAMGGQADQIIAIEKLIAVYSDYQTDIIEISQANISFQNNIIKDVKAYALTALRQKFIMDPYLSVTSKASDLVKSNSIFGTFARSMLASGLGRKASKIGFRAATGLATVKSAQHIKNLGIDKKFSLSPMKILTTISTSKKYKDIDPVVAYKIEEAKLKEARRQHEENRRDNRRMENLAKEQLEFAQESETRLNKTLGAFKAGSAGGMGGRGSGDNTFWDTFAGAFTATSLLGGNSKGLLGLGKFALKSAAVVGGSLGLLGLATNNRNEDGSKKAFFGSPDESILESRAVDYGSIITSGAVLGGAVGGPLGAAIGAAIGGLGAVITDNWKEISADEKRSSQYQYDIMTGKYLEEIPNSMLNAINNSNLKDWLSPLSKFQMLQQSPNFMERMVGQAGTAITESANQFQREYGKYPSGTKSYTGIDGIERAIGPNGEDFGVFDYNRINGSTYSGSSTQGAFTLNGSTVASVGSLAVRKNLDMLASAEGGSNPNLNYGYDAVLGDNIHTGTKGKYRPEGDYKPISQMAFPELFEYQSKVRELHAKDVGKEKASSASGRYQYVQKTLEGLYNQYHNDPKKRALMQSYGINFDEGAVYSPSNQDAIAAYSMMEVRGGKAYQGGKISREQFLNNLSKEWASVKNSTGGGSYVGQGAPTDAGNTIDLLRMDNYDGSKYSDKFKKDLEVGLLGSFNPSSMTNETLLSDVALSASETDKTKPFSLMAPVIPEKETIYSKSPDTFSSGFLPPTNVTPTVKKSSKKSLPASRGSNPFGMPVLQDIPTFDTDLGVLILASPPSN